MRRDEMKTIKLGIAGLGRIGKIHLKNLCRNFPEVDVVGAMDVLDESQSIADEYNVRSFVKTIDALLALPDLDGIIFGLRRFAFRLCQGEM